MLNTLQSLVLFFGNQAKAFQPEEDYDSDDDDDAYSDDEEFQSPIDDVDPFIFFVESVKGNYHKMIFVDFHLGEYLMWNNVQLCKYPIPRGSRTSCRHWTSIIKLLLVGQLNMPS